MNPKVLELFGGIGAPRIALEKMGVKADYKYIDFDKRQVNMYNLMFNENNEVQDIRDYKSTDKFNLVVAGFPCQPFSIAGKGQGLHDDKGRGDLYLETLRVIDLAKPEFVVFENVKGILSAKHKWIIEEIESEMKKRGYQVKTHLLNSHDFNSVQARQRVFIVCSKREIQDIENFKKPLTKKLLDYLEDNVDENLYYDDDKINKILAWKSQEKPLSKVSTITTTKTKTITTRTQPGTASQLTVADNVGGAEKIDILQYKNYYYHRRVKDNKLIPGAYNRVWNNPEKIGTVASSNVLKIDELMDERTRVPELFYKSFNAENYVTGENSQTFGTITANGANSRQRVLLKDLRIRSITPRESWRLMGIDDKYFENVKHLPKSHLYFGAGNSMEINTIEAILKILRKK